MGGNSFGQIGLGAADGDAHPTAAQLTALGGGVVQVAAGWDFSAALTAGRSCRFWLRILASETGVLPTPAPSETTRIHIITAQTTTIIKERRSS